VIGGRRRRDALNQISTGAATGALPPQGSISE